jgi:hypothetical protein
MEQLMRPLTEAEAREIMTTGASHLVKMKAAWLEKTAGIIASHCFDNIEWGRCECGTEFDSVDDWAKHVAGLIVAGAGV